MVTTVQNLAEQLRQAIESSDEKTIAGLASAYSGKEREKVLKAYLSATGTTAADAIRKALKNGPTENLLAYLWDKHGDVRAKLLRNALSGKNDEAALIDLVIHCSPEDWYNTCTEYTTDFKRVLNDDLLSDIGTKEQWTKVFKYWILHKRTERFDIDGDEQRLVTAINKKDYETIAEMLGTTTISEYGNIVRRAEITLGKTIDQAFSAVWSKQDLAVLLAAHYELIHPARLAFRLLKQALDGKKPDEARIIRITALTFDACLAMKYAAKEADYDIGSAFAKSLDKRLAPLVKILWRVV